MEPTKDLKCPKCGNQDQDQFATLTDGYSAPRRDGYRGAIVLVGAQCKVCGEKIIDQPADEAADKLRE